MQPSYSGVDPLAKAKRKLATRKNVVRTKPAPRKASLAAPAAPGRPKRGAGKPRGAFDDEETTTASRGGDEYEPTGFGFSELEDEGHAEQPVETAQDDSDDESDSFGDAGGSAVAIDLPARPPAVRADPGLLERAVANVMANAQAASPPGLAVRVQAGPVGDRVEIRVIDQGPGIPAGQRQQIFQPFRRRDDTAGGLGLGLAIAQGFTEAMDGDLTVEDTPGGGATFVFSLPRADSVDQAKEGPP